MLLHITNHGNKTSNRLGDDHPAVYLATTKNGFTPLLVSAQINHSPLLKSFPIWFIIMAAHLPMTRGVNRPSD